VRAVPDPFAHKVSSYRFCSYLQEFRSVRSQGELLQVLQNLQEPISWANLEFGASLLAHKMGSHKAKT